MAEGPKNNDFGSSGQALIRSIWSSGLSDIISEGAEIVLDAKLSEGPLRDIPIFGWIFKTYGVVKTIREWIFHKKIILFLQETQATTVEERMAFAEKMEADPKYQRKVGEDLFLLLERHECVEKSELLGRVFTAVIRHEISYEEYERYAFIIDRLFLRDLTNLAQHYDNVSNRSLDPRTIEALLGIGLLDARGWVAPSYHRNDLGEKLIRLISPNKGSV
jgi:hypothetical protein